MKKILVVFGVLLLIGSTVGMAYALAEPPSKETLIRGVESVNRYSFTREVTFDQFHVMGIHNGTAPHVEKKFAYTGKVVARGQVDLTGGTVKEYEEFYMNGTLVMSGNVTVNLRTGDVSGRVKLANGTVMDVVDFWKEYFGLSREEALLMFQENLPLVSLRKRLQEGGKVEIAENDPVGGRILRGLGLEGKTYSYDIETPSGTTWTLTVDDRGRPVRFTSEGRNAKVVVVIKPTE
jgi:hypothetical protein